MRLSIGCCSSGCHLPHIDDVETEVLKAVGNISPGVSGEGDGLLP
jgi:hypothetical protein